MLYGLLSSDLNASRAIILVLSYFCYWVEFCAEIVIYNAWLQIEAGQYNQICNRQWVCTTDPCLPIRNRFLMARASEHLKTILLAARIQPDQPKKYPRVWHWETPATLSVQPQLQTAVGCDSHQPLHLGRHAKT
jgi:hypothetical protein